MTMLAGILTVALITTAQVEAEPRPNILLVITDDQRYDMLGTVDPRISTPNLDRLAREGVRFRQAFVTTPICAASRASILTGTYERTHKYTFGTPPLAKRFTDLSYPVLLRSAGYRTGHVGKFGVSTEAGQLFDSFVSLSPPYFRTQPDGSQRHLSDITADKAIEFLGTQQREQPFALTVSFNAPHADDGNPQQYFWPAWAEGLYSDLKIERPPLSDPDFYNSLPEFLRDSTLNRVRWHWRFDNKEKAERMTKGYYRMVSGVDGALGRILGELGRLGLEENTVIVFISDNGYFLGERGYAGKWLPYDLSTRVPLIIRNPRMEGRLRGAKPAAMALNIDIAPTLLEIAGVQVPKPIQGRSLVPILNGRVPSGWRRDFFVEHLYEHPNIPKHEGVRSQQYLYARYFEQQPVYEELYDLRNDPQQAKNLAQSSSYKAVLETMRLRTDELRDQYGGPYKKVSDN